MNAITISVGLLVMTLSLPSANALEDDGALAINWNQAVLDIVLKSHSTGVTGQVGNLRHHQRRKRGLLGKQNQWGSACLSGPHDRP